MTGVLERRFALAERGTSARNLGPSRETGGLFDQGPEGTEQTLVPGVAPLSDKARMEAAAQRAAEREVKR